jgi:hypothetical protein
MKRRYLDPKNVIPFKRVFGENPELLQSFLNAGMPFLPDQYIKSLEYLPPELAPDNPSKKDSLISVCCTDNFGNQFIIEVLIYWNTSFMNHIVFNEFKTYIRQLDLSEDYRLAQPIHSLIILNDVYNRDNINYYHYHKSIDSKGEYIDGLEYVIMELPKFKPVSLLLVQKRMKILWLRFLKEITDGCIEPAPELLANEYIRKAIDLCEYETFSTAELEAYDRHWDTVRRERNDV